MPLPLNQNNMTYKPFKIGSKFRIVPPDTPNSGDDRIDLVMQRGAFGSGEHETTVSCLEQLGDMSNLPGARILDLGSGTGILAIAALKLGAAHAVCIDIEAQAVATAESNCRLNDLKNQVTHITGTLDAVTEGDFDLVLANIYGDILLDLAKAVSAKVKPGGVLLLSGILWDYNFDVRQAYERRGCEVIRNSLLDEFSTVLLQKSKGG